VWVPVLQTTIRTTLLNDDGCHAVLVSGELDLDIAPRLRECFSKLIESGANGILLDLLEVNFMDSAALGVLIATGKALRQAGGELVVVADSPTLKKLLTITGAGRVFRVETSLLSAVDHVVERSR
jgi:anti-sigma B factor antagonist